MKHLRKFNEEFDIGAPAMRRWVLNTKSESSDYYTYFIMHPQEPTSEELERFLMAHSVDRDEDRTYEYVQDVEEIKDEEFQRIPEE